MKVAYYMVGAVLWGALAGWNGHYAISHDDAFSSALSSACLMWALVFLVLLRGEA